MPRFYGNKMQRKMDVGAGCEDLRARCPYFYEVACKMHEATGSQQVASFVNNTFRARYKVLYLAHPIPIQERNRAQLVYFSHPQVTGSALQPLFGMFFLRLYSRLFSNRL